MPKRRSGFGLFPTADETVVLPDLDGAETGAMFAARIGVGIVEALLDFALYHMVAVVEKTENIGIVIVVAGHDTPRKLNRRADSRLQVNRQFANRKWNRDSRICQ